MSPDYVYPKTSHLDHPSVFSEIKLPNDKDQLEAIEAWELAADAKYIDILGYGQLILYASIAPEDCAKIEVERINSLLKTGSCELLTGYNDFDLAQIPLCYKAMLIGRWTDFTSVEATKAYLKACLDAEQNDEKDDAKIEDYFSRKWVVATQVQALVWYKEFMLDVVKNGISFREDKNPTDDDKGANEEPTNDKYTIKNNRFVLAGDYWDITFNQESVGVKNTKGIRYIEHLIRNIGKEVHVLELFYAINPKDATQSNESLSGMNEEQLAAEGFGLDSLDGAFELVDGKTIAALKLRIEQLNEQIEDATEIGDIEEQEKLKAEKDQIISRLSSDMGLRGKGRMSNSAAEKARKSVGKRISADIQKLQKTFPNFADHLQQAIIKGTYCQYKPVPELFWENYPKK
jgi:hypothetical protein